MVKTYLSLKPGDNSAKLKSELKNKNISLAAAGFLFLLSDYTGAHEIQNFYPFFCRSVILNKLYELEAVGLAELEERQLAANYLEKIYTIKTLKL